MMYIKAWIMVAILAGQFVVGADTDGISQEEWVALAIVFFGAISVYVAPNVPQYPWVKTGVGATLVGLNLLTQFILDGVSSTEWVMIVVAVLGALGLVLSPDKVTVRPGA